MRQITILLVAMMFMACTSLHLWSAEGPPLRGPVTAAPAPSPDAPTVPSIDVDRKREDEEPEPEEDLTKVPKPTQGRIVLCSFRDKRGKLITRPAIVVHVFEDTGTMPLINLQAFVDGSNDSVTKEGDGTFWVTSAHYSGKPKDHTWRWMPFQLGQAAKTESVTDDANKRIRILETGFKNVLDACHQAMKQSHADAVAESARAGGYQGKIADLEAKLREAERQLASKG